MTLSDVRAEPPAKTQHNLREVPMNQPAPKPSKTATELAGAIQETIGNLELVLERIGVATKRGLDDSLGASSGGGEPVGGTRDFTQRMLDKLGGGGAEKDGTARPLEQNDPARKSLSMLVASVGAARDWSQRAKTETFRLEPLTLEKATLLLGEGPSQCLNANCHRDVWRTPNDRLRAGRCEACYRYWQNHDRNDERPKSLCRPEEKASA